MSDYLIGSWEDFKKYFILEWPQNRFDEIVRSGSMVIQLYEKAIGAGYNLPSSLLYNIYASLMGYSFLTPGYKGNNAGEYEFFLQMIRKSLLLYRINLTKESAKTKGENGKTISPEEVWEAILYIFRHTDILSLTTPLYDPDFLMQGIEQLLSWNLQVDQNDPFYKEIADHIKSNLPGEKTSVDCNPYLYFIQDKYKTLVPYYKEYDPDIHLEMVSALVPFRSSWQTGKILSSHFFNDLVAIKYLHDYRLDEDAAIFRRIRRRMELKVNTPDPEFFTREFSIIARMGQQILPSELAYDWDVILYKILNNLILRVTSPERETPPIRFNVYIDVYLELINEQDRSWDNLSLGDHMHALALLAAHDIFYYLIWIPKLIVEINLELKHIRNNKTIQEGWNSCNTMDLETEIFSDFSSPVDYGESDNVFRRPFLIESPTTIVWFRGLDIFSFFDELLRNPAMTSETGQDADGIATGDEIDREKARSRNAFHLIVKSKEPQGEDLFPDSAWLKVTDQETSLFFWIGGKWEKAEIRRPDQSANIEPIKTEKICRINIVMAVLDAVDRVVASFV
jgi:hypothetical protein